MKCADLETLLCDYVDGALGASERRLVEDHIQACPACAALLKDAAAAVRFISQAAPVEPPPELVTRILFHLSSHEETAHAGRRRASGWLSRWWRPLLQPRFAMGMAMTILSFSMLGRFAGISPRQLTPADLHPAKLWQALDDRAHRAWERARKFYLSLRVVYEIQTQLREWTQQLQEEEASVTTPGGYQAEPAAQPPPDPRGQPPSVSGKQSDRAP